MILKVNITRVLDIINNHKIEMLISLFLYVIATLLEYDIVEGYHYIAMTIIAAAVAYSLNNTFRAGWGRVLYFISPLPLLSLPFWGVDSEWVTSSQGVLSLYILSPLLMILSKRSFSNKSFVDGVIEFIFSILLAFLFTGVITLLVFIILHTVDTIFSFDISDKIEFYFYSFAYAIIAPILFLYFDSEKREKKMDNSKAAIILINYIFTPAILIYASILYIYIIKALVTMELPRGNIAYLVFGFTLFSLGVKSLRLTIEKRVCSLFFDNFSYIALPILALFWFGVIERISQYGFTDWRVYLLVCGVVMTICVVMFIFKRYASYYIIASLLFISYFVIAYIPHFSAEEIALRSQKNRVYYYLKKLEMLDGSNLIIKEKKGGEYSDIDCEKLYSSLCYVMDRDITQLKNIGVDYIADVTDVMPGEKRYKNYRSNTFYFNFHNTSKKFDISKYRYFYELFDGSGGDKYENYYIYDGKILDIYLSGEKVCSIDSDELILDNVNRIVAQNNIRDINRESLLPYKENFTFYKNDSLMVIFDGLNFSMQNEVIKVYDVDINTIFVK